MWACFIIDLKSEEDWKPWTLLPSMDKWVQRGSADWNLNRKERASKEERGFWGMESVPDKM